MADDPTETLDGHALDALRESVGGDQEFLAELINEFLDDAPHQLEVLRAAVESGDADVARRAAHTLKSHGATFGVRRLEAASRALEAAALEGRLDGTHDLIVEIDTALIEAKPELTAVAAGVRDRSTVRVPRTDSG